MVVPGAGGWDGPATLGSFNSRFASSIGDIAVRALREDWGESLVNRGVPLARTMQ